MKSLFAIAVTAAIYVSAFCFLPLWAAIGAIVAVANVGMIVHGIFPTKK